MMETLHKNAYQFQQILRRQGYDQHILQLPKSTRTASEAAAAIDCQVAQIAKSIIFMLQPSGRPLLVIASGRDRIDEQKTATYIGETLGKADADYVREHTGYAIGGVPPLAHTEPIRTLIDESLLQFEELWAAAGHAQAVMRLTPADLIEMTGGDVAAVTS